jgi:hypothetical protein
MVTYLDMLKWDTVDFIGKTISRIMSEEYFYLVGLGSSLVSMNKLYIIFPLVKLGSSRI